MTNSETIEATASSDKDIKFTCIGRSHGSAVIPAGRKEWEEMRNQPWLEALCTRIENGEEKLKATLPVWTPRCIEFEENHRKQEMVLKALRRLVFDIDDKGLTDKVMEMLKTEDGQSGVAALQCCSGKNIDTRLFIGSFEVLMIEESVRRGTHIVVRLPEGMTANEAQAKFKEETGFKVDASVKNPAGCIYMVSESHARFYSRRFFEEVEIIEDASANGTDANSTAEAAEDTDHSASSNIKEVSSDIKEVSSDIKEEKGEEDLYDATLKYHGILIKDMVAKYLELFNEGHEPCLGDRNTMTFELGVTFRTICDYNLDMLKRIIPRYGGLEAKEWSTALEHANNQPRKGVPYRMRQVLKALKDDHTIKATGGTSSAPPAMPKRLPAVIKLLTRNVPDYYKPTVATAIFPTLAAHIHGVKFRYIDNKLHEPTFLNLIIAPQSMGKGCIKEPTDCIMEDIKERDKPNREREAEWKRKNPTGKTKEKDPRPNDIVVQYLVNDLTNAIFNQRVVDANNNGGYFLYIRSDEVEGLKKLTSHGTIEETTLLLRYAFDNAEVGQDRYGADSVSGFAPLRLVMNVSTTPVNARRFFVNGVSDGTVSRLDISTIIREEGDHSMPIFGIYDDAFNQELKGYLNRLMAANGLIECPQAEKLAREICKENEDNANLYESNAYRIFSYRANVIAYLKGMVLYVANGYKWDKSIADFVRWSCQYNLWCKMKFFGKQLEDELNEEHEIMRQSGPQNRLALLPDVFTTEDYRQMRVTQGLKDDNGSTLRSWKRRGYIEYDEVEQAYVKTEKYRNKQIA